MSLPFDDALSRQRRLIEVGTAGQARIEAHQFTLPTRQPELVREYLERAGAESFREGDEPNFPHEHSFLHPTATQLGRATWFALRQLREALGIQGTADTARGGPPPPKES